MSRQKILFLKYFHFDRHKVSILLLGLVFFCFSISAALLFQKLILPHLTSILAPGMALTIDSVRYDSIALEMAQQIKQHGWSSWQLFPNNYTSPHVSILAALYAVFGHDPTLAIPLNALFHALGGVLVFMIVIELSSNYLVGVCAGIIASFIFVLFPSALNWYGQILKDGYAIVGVLAILLIWLKGVRVPPNTGKSFFLILLSLLVLCFLVIIRPYYFKLILLFLIIWFIAMIIARFFLMHKNAWVFFLYVILTFAPAYGFLDSIGTFSQARSGEAYAAHQIKGWGWQTNDLLPRKLDKQLEIVAKTRGGLIAAGIDKGASSIIDSNETPSSFGEVIRYLPRAFQIALLAPFPSTWLEKISMPRLLASAEMVVIYSCLFGLIPLLRLNKSPQVIFAFCFSAFFLLVYGFVSANLGTLYRVRYAFELIMVMLGVIGWVSLLNHKGVLRHWFDKLKERAPPFTTVIDNPVEKKGSMSRKSVIGASGIVSFITLIGFMGFFLRDVLMAHEFGFGKDLDGFFLALLIPMFVVTVFCIPLGAASVPFLNRISEKESSIKLDEIVSHLLSIVLLVIFFVSIFIFFLSPAIFERLQMEVQGIAVNESLSTLLVLALVILILSGAVILGNSVLMVKERLIIPSAAQLVVPVIAVLALFLFGNSYGVVSVMAGMVVGQIVNLIIVHLYLKKYEVSLIPRYKATINQDLSVLWGQYFPLLASAFFAGVILPIDIMLASSVENGSVSIFNLGMKVVLFISGLLGVVVSNVLFPYFSSMVEKKNHKMVKKELSFFMLVATFISIPASVIFYIGSEHIVRLVFYNGTFAESDLMAVKRVMQYSVVQIPFFICNILLLKYATATRHLIVISFSAFFGLLLNIGLSLALMPVMGVSGIALATSVAMIASSALILIMLSFYGHISIVDMMLVLLNWLLFLTTMVALHFQSIPSVVMAIFSYSILLFAYYTYYKLTKDNEAIYASS